MHRRQEPRGLSGRSCDRRRHRLHAGDRPHPRIRQARLVRARSQARARRRRRHAHAAQAGQRRCVQALFAGGGVALCAPLAAVPHAERRVPCRQYPSRGHARCSISCSRPMPGFTAARSTRPPRRHAIVADHVVRHVRTILDRQDAPQTCSRAGRSSGRPARLPRNYSRSSLETGAPGSSRLNNAGASATRSMMHSSCPLTSTLAAASMALS